jgi:7-carboxy-7-deazaguanine synthase
MKQALRVVELFRSIQGESTWAGLPCVFVRLAGCNLQCSYCDTRYASEEPGAETAVDEVCARVEGMATRLVCLTGGEPLLQEAAPAIASRLMESGHTVLVETNGTLDISRLPANTIRVMDVKCPGSGECGKTLMSNLSHLKPHDEVKFVLCDRRDFDWAADFVRRQRLTDRCHVLFACAVTHLAGTSSAPDTATPRRLAQWVLDAGLPVRLQLQLHKILWPERTRGV